MRVDGEGCDKEEERASQRPLPPLAWPSLKRTIQPFWRFFEEISSIPRASKHEAAVLAYIKSFAEERGLPWREDDYGNMVVTREGFNGGEDAATVVIQGRFRRLHFRVRGESSERLVCLMSLGRRSASAVPTDSPPPPTQVLGCTGTFGVTQAGFWPLCRSRHVCVPCVNSSKCSLLA